MNGTRAAWVAELEAMAPIPVTIVVAIEGKPAETVSNVDARSIAFQSVPTIRPRGKRGKPVLCLTFETVDTYNPVIYTFPNVSGWSTTAD